MKGGGNVHQEKHGWLHIFRAFILPAMALFFLFPFSTPSRSFCQDNSSSTNSCCPSGGQNSALFVGRVIHFLAKFGVECHVALLPSAGPLVKHLAMAEWGNVEVECDCRVRMGGIFHPMKANLIWK